MKELEAAFIAARGVHENGWMMSLYAVTHQQEMSNAYDKIVRRIDALPPLRSHMIDSRRTTRQIHNPTKRCNAFVVIYGPAH